MSISWPDIRFPPINLLSAPHQVPWNQLMNNSEWMYHPKGSMCASCVYRGSDCSELPFSEMRVIARNGPFIEVKCDKHEKISESV